jgi:glycosyltransferase involved in cell wall biosynthesis
LEEYYRRKGALTVRIPVLVDMKSDNYSEKLFQNNYDNPIMRIAFVGNAGKKDLLVNAIRGLDLFMKNGGDCELIIVGPSRDEMFNELGNDCYLLDKYTDKLHFIGFVCHDDALKYLSKSDYSILLRKNIRYANAGFPSKLVESLSVGVPVICNITSDIGKYVADGKEGLIIPDCSPESFATGLQRAVKISGKERVNMRINAFYRAKESFDYRNWSIQLNEFMTKINKQEN